MLRKLNIPYLYKKSTRSIYFKWRDFHREKSSQLNVVLGILVALLMIPGDALFLTEYQELTRVRTLDLMIGVFSLILLSIIRYKVLLKKWPGPTRAVLSFLLISPIALYNFEYYYFLYDLKIEEFNVYLIGLLLGIFFGSFLLFQYWIEHYIFHVFFMGYTAYYYFALQDSPKQNSLFILIITHLVTWFLMFTLRREFVFELFNKFQTLKMFLPKELATHAAFAHKYNEIQSQFKTSEMFTVCLCCDWRNYQKIAKKHAPDIVQKAMENYYNLVFTQLELIDPKGEYYSNWTADELFLTFFSQDNNQEDTLNRAMKFARELRGSIFQSIKETSEIDIMFDIGMATGEALVGLQGPSSFKKLTVTGHVPGTAKRIEREAKSLRQSTPQKVNQPILLVDEEIYQKFKQDFCFSRVTGHIKDIGGQSLYRFVDEHGIEILKTS